jgi:hypothetical protein
MTLTQFCILAWIAIACMYLGTCAIVSGAEPHPIPAWIVEVVS